MNFSAIGVREGIKAGPLVSLVDQNQRSLSYRAPYLAHDRLETQTVLVLTPHSSIFAVGWLSLSLATLIASLF